MPIIQRLSDTLINQIAAGEVVERPASVAKELCENALDAGATEITVEITEGGIRRIVVTDNGCGMRPEDARACLERHATSKLRAESGLKSIGTLGFRGEALPAIASVSRFTLVTRPNPKARRVLASWEEAVGEPQQSAGSDDAEAMDSAAGTRVFCEGGARTEVEETGARPGTRIEVCDLFFNTPARRKFLKRPATEATNLIEAVSRLAAARPQVAFRLVSGGREIFASPAVKDPRERMAVVLGPEAAKHLMPADFSRDGIRVRGFITDPDFTLSNARGIYTFVNGRFVQDRSLTAVIQRAYRDVTMPDRNPACVLFIELPLSDVDVNVHPRKLEVRFADAQAVTGCVWHAVQESMRDSPWLRQRQAAAAPLDAGVISEPAEAYDGAGTGALSGADPSLIWRDSGASRAGFPRHSYADVPLAFRPGPGTVLHPLAAPSGASVTDGMGEEASSPGAPTGFFRSLRVIGQFAATYVVCEAPGPKLVVIDQHAAHERVRFHALREAFRRKKPESQPFLMPMTLEFSPAEAAALAENRLTLAEIGFEIEPFGGASVALKAVPKILVGCDLRQMLASLAGEILQAGRTKAYDEAVDHALATMACHSAIRAHEIRSPEELRALLDALDEVDFNTRCPHGRPVAAQITVPDLEKEVARR